MPFLPDGRFVRGERWFALRGRPKNHTEVLHPCRGEHVAEEFWAKYDGYGCEAFQAHCMTLLHVSK